MDRRHTSEHLEAWRRDGGLVMPGFFTPEEVAAVVADCERLFGREAGAAAPLVKRRGDDPGSFHASQFETIRPIPLDCSPALNLIGVHPALIALAKDALETDDVHVYQCQAWAKFTGASDYAQPYHCDYQNHTLTAPPEGRRNALTVMCYFTDVTDAHGPTQYVAKPDSDRLFGPEETLAYQPEAQKARNRRLEPFTRTALASAGSIFPYTIDVFHRGTNLTAPNGYRYTVTTCFKRAGGEAVSFYAWAFHNTQPWARIFDHATPDQLACFGVPKPGDPFWTEVTIARTQARYPGWNAGPYRQALPG